MNQHKNLKYWKLTLESVKIHSKHSATIADDETNKLQ